MLMIIQSPENYCDGSSKFEIVLAVFSLFEKFSLSVGVEGVQMGGRRGGGLIKG